MYKKRSCHHMFKLDPNKDLSEDALRKVCTSGTDGIIIGGTDGVTFENVTDLQDRVQQYDIAVYLEVSDIEAIAPGFQKYLIPMVLNSQDKKWMIDVQHQAIVEYADAIAWEDMMPEGYCVLNPEAKVFQRTNCTMPQDRDVLAYAEMAEHMFRLPFFYMEYSGMYGDPDLVRQVSERLEKTSLIYGGGIRSAEQAGEMASHADIVVIGNVIYEDMESAIGTVEAVKTIH
ncbi:heptaprenylglyceryl phosphate synthase [Halobacillus sp. KGW1]|uniref:heptaprenylglyceryl phosphate synthase n=1 Tax=Halobacillus sp. KGW1 TaxID=1793726 RepID=UPI000780B6D1|nr:heptaprenylglyceryl phosphate synthase [Halobacillus sp. KGW1]